MVMKLRHWILTLFLAISVSLPAFATEELPDWGSYDEHLLSLAKEQELGNAFMQAVYRSQLVLADPLLDEYLNQLGDRLVANSQAKDRDFYFFILKNPRINAVAGPGGYIGVYSGLLLVTESESELAAVMAHEIAHVSQRHLARKLEHSRIQNLANIGGVIAAILIGTQTSTQVGIGAAQAVLSHNQENNLSFSRSNEAEADRIGLQILKRANFDPQGMQQFFQHMQQNNLYSSNSYAEWTSTHPLTIDRMADVSNRTSKSTRQYSSSQQYYLMRERLRVLTSDNIQELIGYYQTEPETETTQQRMVRQYGLGLALLQNFQLTAAETEFSQLVKNYPDKIIFKLALAETWMAQNKSQAALDLLKQNSELYPEDYTSLYQYTTALVQTGHYQTAKQLLTQALRKDPTDMNLLALQVQAAGNSGDAATAHQAQATLYMLNGETGMAKRQLQQALNAPKVSNYDQKIIKAKMMNLQ